MDYTNIRKLSLKVFLGFLGLTALIGIISLLSGAFGKTQIKILATCLTISGASICSMACAAFIEKKRLPALGLSAIILTVIAALLLIIGMWPEIDSKVYWKPTITLGVGAIACAYAFLLVLPVLDDNQKWVQLVSSVSIGILGLQITMAIWAEIKNKGYYRLLGVVAIIVGLETLAIPILMKLRKGDIPKKQKLVLEKLKDDIYQDNAGKKYKLEKVDS